MERDLAPYVFKLSDGVKKDAWMMSVVYVIECMGCTV